MSADDRIWKRGGGFHGSRRGGGGRGGRRGRPRGREGHPLNRIEDEDGDSYMDEAQSNKPRYQPYNKGEGRVSAFSRLGERSSGSSGSTTGRRLGGLKSDSSGESWHKITVFQGASQSREWLLRTLKESVSEPFMAEQIHQLGDKLMFFVNDSRAAGELRELGTVQSKSGPLKIAVKPSDPPKGKRDGGGASGGFSSERYQRPPRFARSGMNRSNDDDVSMDEDPTEVIKEVLGERFNTQTRALDLTDLFHEQKFRQHRIKASMFDQRFVESILSIIGEHCPDLLALDLSNNRLQRLEVYASLPSKCKQLKTLNLSNNEIHSIAELEHIRGMESVTSLLLKNNPLVSQMSSVRRFFPNLETLDDQNLPSPVKFDLPVSVGQIPPYVANHLPEGDVKVLIVRFLEQYYSLYDGESREKLLEAYDDNALFSMSVIFPDNQRDYPLQSYLPKSRNLLRVKDPAKRQSLLKHGRIDIVQFLRDLPRTKHQSDLFEVDVIRAAGTETAFVVHGVFCEESDKKDLLIRSFTRTFIIAATGASVVILNDLLAITTASPKSIQFVKQKIQSPQIPPQQPLTTSLSSVQQESIKSLAEATKMNFDYCNKCLLENNWDLSSALTVFTTLQSQGKIPPEAFS